MLYFALMKNAVEMVKNFFSNKSLLIFVLSTLFFTAPVTAIGLNSEIYQTFLVFVAVLIATLIWFINTFRIKRVYIPHSPLLYSIFGLFGAVFISTLFSAENLLPSVLGDVFEARTLFFYITVALLTLLSSIFFYEKKRIDGFMAGMKLGIGITLVAVLLQSTGILGTIFQLPSSQTVAGILGLAIVLIVARIETDLRGSRITKILYWSAMILSIIGLIIMQAIGIWIAVLLSLGILWIVGYFPAFKINGKGRLLRSVMIFALIIGIAGTWINPMIERVTGIQQFQTPFVVDWNIIKGVSGPERLYGVGSNEYNIAWNNVVNNGVNDNEYRFIRFDTGHSYVTTMFIESGFIGLIVLILFILFLIGKTLITAKVRADDNSGSVLSILLSLWFVFFALVFFYPGTLFIILLFILSGMLVSFMMRLSLIKISVIEWQQSFRNKLVCYTIFFFAIVVIVFGTYYGLGRYSALFRANHAYNIADTDPQQAIALLDAARKSSEVDIYHRFYANLVFSNLITEIQSGKLQDRGVIRTQVQSVLVAASEAIKYNPRDITNWLVLADIHARIAQSGIGSGLDVDAKRLFNSLLITFPNHIETYSSYAQYLWAKQDTTEITNLLNIMRSKGITIPEYYLLAAQQGLDAGESDLAEEILRAGIQAYPFNIQIVISTGTVLSQNEKWSEAATVFEYANSIASNIESYFGLATAYEKLGRDIEALVILEELKKLQGVNKSAIEQTIQRIKKKR